MTGSKYRELRKKDNKDKRLLKKLQKYETLRVNLRIRIKEFTDTDNLFDLVEAMRVGNKILMDEGFPIEEFVKYKNG